MTAVQLRVQALISEFWSLARERAYSVWLFKVPSVCPPVLLFLLVGRSAASPGTVSSVSGTAATGRELAKLAGHESAVNAVASSPNGAFVATAGEETRIMLWDQTSRKLSKILYGAKDFINAVSFSPDSRLLAGAGEDARVLIFDVAAGKASLHIAWARGGPSIP